MNLGEQVTGNVLNGKDALDVNVAEVALTAGGGGLNNYVEHTQRPSTDLVVRPFAEIIVRPSTDLIVRPSTDLILRPRAEIVVRPTPPPTPPAKIDMSIRFSGNY